MKPASYIQCKDFPYLDTRRVVLPKSFMFRLPPFFGGCILCGEKYE
jgi:hypothetical protein